MGLFERIRRKFYKTNDDSEVARSAANLRILATIARKHYLESKDPDSFDAWTQAISQLLKLDKFESNYHPSPEMTNWMHGQVVEILERFQDNS